MVNPARDLADFLSARQTKPSGTTIYSERSDSISGPGDLPFWRVQSEIAGLALQVSDIVAAMGAEGRRVHYFQTALRDAFRGVFAPDVAWNSSQAAVELVPASSVELLYALADVIDGFRPGRVITEPEAVSIFSGLADLNELLKDHALGLSDQEERYVFELLRSVRTLIDERSVLGASDLTARINELYGALSLISDSLGNSPESEETRSRIKSALLKVVPFVRNAGGAGLLALDVAANVSQITSGLQ